MIDFHSHILPGIDDGSKDVDMSLKMLFMLREQGCDTVCATSHFYATQRSPSHFLDRRAEAWEALRLRLPEGAPRILLGAEVLYYPGISRMRELPELCLEDTNLLLLEMPFEPWTEHAVHEVTELAHSGEFCILLAHIERYFFQQPIAVWDRFRELGIMMQSNADFFLPLKTRRKAIRLLREGRIDLLSSDAHNVTSRAPRLSEARTVIARRLDPSALRDMDRLGERLLEVCAL